MSLTQNHSETHRYVTCGNRSVECDYEMEITKITTCFRQDDVFLLVGNGVVNNKYTGDQGTSDATFLQVFEYRVVVIKTG